MQTLYANDMSNLPATRNSLELLHASTDRLSKLMTRLSGINLFMKKMEMEEDGFVPIGLDMGYNNAYDDDKESTYVYVASPFCYF